MCFYNGCDWTASIVEKSDTVASKATRCDECGAAIDDGAFIHTVYMQEAEECLRCDNGECTCEEDKCCQCEKPDIGETFDYTQCEGCHKFLEAVKAAEIEAGCNEYTSRPAYTAMIDDIGCCNGDRDEAKRYFKKARVMFPELVTTGYLGKLWRRMFSR